ncbi:MAG: AMP-binding protein [Woeseiaceae bacterium]|nr:AMP-binding protein [Woeseiaceae bacterium]
MNIAAHLERTGRSAGQRTAIAAGERPLVSYAELLDRVRRLAGGLVAELGLKPGDRVALAMRNCPEYLQVLYACWQAGLVAVPVNAKLHGREFAFIIGNSGATACFTTPDLTDTIASASAADRLTQVETGSDHFRHLSSADPLPLADTLPDDPAWLFYTSGTTGQPKGAVLSHRNLLAMSLCYFADVDATSPWRAILHAAPMSHGSGLYALPHVMQGSCHVIPDSTGFDVAEIFGLIERWPHCVFFAAPTMVRRLLDHEADTDTANLKSILYGGGPMYVDDCIAALERFGPKLAQLYGQGESPMTITALSRAMHGDRTHPRWRERLASVGIPQSVVDVRVADSDDRILPPGETGEVLVRGDSVMRGYWQRPEATAETLRNGWLHTGDFGCFDEDGFLTLKDRANDLIISGGTNIYPREVEEVLVGHADVSEASVIGTADREWGERVVAYVVLRPGAVADPQALDRFCLENIARFKRPRDYRFIEALPKNNYGKVLKTALRDMESARKSD